MHPKDELDKLKKLVEATEDSCVNDTGTPNSPKPLDNPATKEADPRDHIDSTKRHRGRPKGSTNKNKGFRKKDQEEKKKAAKYLWEKGIIRWKLDSNQLDLYEAYHNRQTEELIWLWSRQIGKSFAISVTLIEECINKQDLRVAYVTPLKSQTRDIVEKNFQTILKDCPDHLKPKFNSQKAVWEFPSTNSIIKVAGMDGGHIENLRGQTFDIIVIDETGFPSAAEFEYALESVLFPTMTTVERPILVMISTPPKTYDHPFNSYVDKAEVEGTLIVRTLYDCPRLTPEQIRKIEDRYGKDSQHFKREYMCERIPDLNSLVVPEATEAILYEGDDRIVQAWPRPPFFQTYTSADYGVMDLNAVLFGYYDWRNATVVIEDELIMSGIDYDTEKMAEEIRKKELELWGVGKEPLRYCDNNLQIIRDFHNLHKLTFLATHKDNKNAAINEVRMKISGKTVKINPRCKHLISHLKNATWDKNRTKFKRAVDHNYDCLDALIYMIRNIDYMKNPYPNNYFMDGDFISPKWEKNQKLNPFKTAMKEIFTVKKRKK